VKHSAPKSGRWTRIFVVIAVLYAIPVAFAAWTNFPSRSQIEADTAANAIAALQQHEPKYKDIAPQSLRRRLYRGLSDEEVVARVREYAVAEEERINIQASRVSVDPDHAASGTFSGSVNKPQEQLPGAVAPGVDRIRPQIALTMDELEKQREQRLASIKTGQTKVIAWAVAAWVLPLVLLYVLMPRFSWRSRKSVSRI
jgi:hypothetical protein